MWNPCGIHVHSMWDAIDVWIIVLHDPDQKIAFEVSKPLRKLTRTRETTLRWREILPKPRKVIFIDPKPDLKGN